ncbi:MAG: CDP-diacylglycerol--glycerol-3-phosphate 3-phosphatidyltransferase [Clostridiaceae bacterium]|jgi:CDP-diacylglycerol--glycerol-3-phosphate 3-phosphatidyltransferase|nr:CDP-diacylglycerol--glycerol-3-phosphate 3-phosphatidyltransferase [Clostridiaceae bacterium]
MNLPNKITLSRICIVPIFMIFALPLPESLLSNIPWDLLEAQLRALNSVISSYGHYIAAIIFIIASSTDGIDGYIARKTKQVTKFGIFLDPVADKLLVTSALIALVQRGNISGWAAMIIIGRELMVMGLRLVAAGEGVVISASRLGKAKTALQIIAISASLLENFPLSLFTDFRLDSYAITLAVLITIYSGYDYLANNIKLIRGNN